jgi:topoisomerase-4 subunit B
VKHEKVYVLETPLFRVRNKQETIYCYSEDEKQAAVKKLGSKPEITRFKGLGEISPDEFALFIGADMRKNINAFGTWRSYSAVAGILYGKKYNGKAGVYY